MNQYAGIDVSLECPSVYVVDTNGKILREARVASEPEALITLVPADHPVALPIGSEDC